MKKMNQRKLQTKLEEARIENTEAEERQWKVLTHMYLKFRAEWENAADARLSNGLRSIFQNCRNI